MIALTSTTRRLMFAKSGTGTETWTPNTYEASSTSGTYVVVVDDGWQAVTVDDVAAIEIKESSTEQDEPNTDERSVTCERPNRRLATVERAWRTNEPRKAAPRWG